MGEQVGVPGSLGTSIVFLLSTIAVLAWFCWSATDVRLRAVAERRQKMRWFRSALPLEEDLARQRRGLRCIGIPSAVVCVLIAASCSRR